MGNVRILSVREPEKGNEDIWSFLRSLWGSREIVKVNLYEKPSWREKGWVKEGTVYRGKYVTKYGAWDGMIGDRAGEFEVFIAKPPQELRKHEHWKCWQKAGKGEIFKLHITEEAKGVGSVILNVENMINQSFEL
jgi:hypothetical protein